MDTTLVFAMGALTVSAELAWELPIERLGPKDSFESAAER